MITHFYDKAWKLIKIFQVRASSVIYSIIPLSSWQDSFFVWHIYFCSLIFFIYLSIFFFFVCYTLFFPFSYPFFALISYLTNSFSIPQIDKWKKKTYKRAHYPKKEYATYQPNTLCFAPALLLIPDIQDRRWAKVQVRKRMGLIISKYRLGYRHTGYGCRKMEQTSTIWTVQKRNNKRANRH